MKTCLICKKDFPLDHFGPSSQKADGRMPYCRPCDNERKKAWIRRNYEHSRNYMREYQKKWRAANPEKSKLYDRRTDLKRKYGITIEQYEHMLVDQHGRCAICNLKQGDLRGYQLYVDHDHATGKVRGLLCNNCNFALGQFKDSEILIKRALQYLRRNKTC